MYEPNSKQRLITHTAFAVGVIGAIGIAFLLWHTLHNCYPFKVMSFPSASFFERLANIGLFISPILSVAFTKLIKPVRVWLLPILPTVICPIIFLTLFELSCTWYKWQESTGAIIVGRNFDGNTLDIIKPEFTEQVFWLSITGLIVGFLCGVILQKLFTVFREKRLA